MYKNIGLKVGPAQKSYGTKITIEYPHCDDINYLEDINQLHNVDLILKEPRPLTEEEDDTTFLAFQYLKEVEKLVLECYLNNKTEKDLVKSLEEYFLTEFKDLQHIRLSATVYTAKENWKNSTDNNIQHHLFPKGQIAKFAEPLYRLLLDPTLSSKKLFEVLGIDPKLETKPGNNMNLALFTKHLLRLGFNLKDGPTLKVELQTLVLDLTLFHV